MWCQSAPSDTTLPNYKWMDVLKKVINVNLLFLLFFILSNIFDILNCLTLGTTFEFFDTIILVWTSCCWHHIHNLILAKNKKYNAGINTWFLVLCRNGRELLVPNGWCQRHAQLGFEHWVLEGPLWSKTVGFCDLHGNPYAPVSK